MKTNKSFISAIVKVSFVLFGVLPAISLILFGALPSLSAMQSFINWAGNDITSGTLFFIGYLVLASKHNASKNRIRFSLAKIYA